MICEVIVIVCVFVFTEAQRVHSRLTLSCYEAKWKSLFENMIYNNDPLSLQVAAPSVSEWALAGSALSAWCPGEERGEPRGLLRSVCKNNDHSDARLGSVACWLSHCSVQQKIDGNKDQPSLATVRSRWGTWCWLVSCETCLWLFFNYHKRIISTIMTVPVLCDRRAAVPCAVYDVTS